MSEQVLFVLGAVRWAGDGYCVLVGVVFLLGCFLYDVGHFQNKPKEWWFALILVVIRVGGLAGWIFYARPALVVAMQT